MWRRRAQGLVIEYQVDELARNEPSDLDFPNIPGKRSRLSGEFNIFDLEKIDGPQDK